MFPGMVPIKLLQSVLLWQTLNLSYYVSAVCSPHKKEPKVLILGAGMSGVSAAMTLQDAGFTNFQIIEASNRVGGRMKETKIGDYTVELGAMWIYGKGTNPVYDLAMKYNVSFVESFINNWTVRNRLGVDITDAANKVYAKFENIMKELDSKANDAISLNTSDFTVLSALEKQGWLPRSQIDNLIEEFVIDFETGIRPSDLSGKYLYIQEPYETFKNHQMLVINDKNGFSSLPKQMISNFMSDGDERLVLNKCVTNIEQSSDKVRVVTSDDSVYEADYAIVTFSLGVLQQREVTFSPVLPQWKMNSIDAFGMCHFVHIYIQFPNTFWNKTMYIVHLSKKRGKNSVWLNVNTIHPGSNILQVSIYGNEAKRIEKLDDMDVINDMIHDLKAMYPTEIVPNVTNYNISRWNSDPFFRGAWSYWPPGFTYANMRELAAPFGRIHFAGEYTNPKQYGFLHSAHISGVETALKIIKCSTNHDSYSSIGSQEIPFSDGGVVCEAWIVYIAMFVTCFILSGLYRWRCACREKQINGF